MSPLDPAEAKRIEHIFKYIDLEMLTDSQEQLIISFGAQWTQKRWLSERQIEILEDIFRRANES